ncbi:MAG TPA: hypothetical protein VFF77_01070, partial [Holophagaceae bacterium]|nr:hypothetical protein [Holophagaceae bacterium]
MPIYAPSLPPKPDLSSGRPPALVILAFDLQRVLRQKMGRFFGFVFTVMLIWRLGYVYIYYMKDQNAVVSKMMEAASSVLAQGAEWHADMLGGWLTYLLWFLVALIGGGLVARDTLYRVRPLMYAHPVKPSDYWIAKISLAALVPFAILTPFALLPWLLSVGLTGLHGVMWASTPLRLLPVALIIALLMGAVASGASSLASTPRAGIGWVLGVVLGLEAMGGMLYGLLGNGSWMAISPMTLAAEWPKLLCGVTTGTFGWVPALIGTTAHLALWTLILKARTRPSEAV